MSLTPEFDYSFQRLLAAWGSHHRNAMTGASIPELYASRQALEEARAEARLARRNFNL